MIKYYKGTVFNTGADAIVNTVNCDGFMGAGIALEFSLRYPDLLKDYERKCKNFEIKVGQVDYFNNEKEKITIVNFPTKEHFKYPSKMEWIRAGLLDFAKTFKAHKINSVAFPKLGTYNGGLDWNKVKQLMENVLYTLDLEVYICLDEDKNAEGLEKKMLNIMNEINISSLKKQVRLTSKQEQIIKENVPFKRFWHIKDLDGIGITTYSNLHKFCNQQANLKHEQLSLF